MSVTGRRFLWIGAPGIAVASQAEDVHFCGDFRVFSGARVSMAGGVFGFGGFAPYYSRLLIPTA